MVLPVTVWLAGPTADGPLCGLTVSSVLIAQGRPPQLAGLVSPESDLAEAICKPGGRFVVHLLGAAHRRLAQHFSGELPAPAGQLQAEASAHGPVLKAVDDRLACRCLSWKDFGWSVLVEAEVDAVTGGPARAGLAWYHGSYRTVSPTP